MGVLRLRNNFTMQEAYTISLLFPQITKVTPRLKATTFEIFSSSFHAQQTKMHNKQRNLVTANPPIWNDRTWASTHQRVLQVLHYSVDYYKNVLINHESDHVPSKACFNKMEPFFHDPCIDMFSRKARMSGSLHEMEEEGSIERIQKSNKDTRRECEQLGNQSVAYAHKAQN